MSSQFIKTRKVFESAISTRFPMTYEEWTSLADDKKAAALYVNFFSAVMAAWVKAKADFVAEEDAISTLMQYLEKNVPIIGADPSRYRPAYISTVSYNSMAALRRGVKAALQHSMTVSQYQFNEFGEEIDLFASYIDDRSDLVSVIDNLHLESGIQKIIDGITDEDILITITHILGGPKPRMKVRKREPEIMQKLRVLFSDYADVYSDGCRNREEVKATNSCLTFSDVLDVDDDVASSVVEMRDGVKAVYYGETRVSHSGATDVVFYGPKYDYFVPIEQAKNLRVHDIEFY